jgi:outer membrane protein assembly factor BamD
MDLGTICPARFQVAGHLFHIRAGAGDPKGMRNTAFRLRSLPTRLVLVVVVFFVLQGCSLFHSLFSSKEPERSPAELMSDGMDSYESGYYETATEAFRELKDKYPYSPYAITAEIRIADALYKRDLYDEAFEAYGEFERLHPKNSEIPYVIYQKGMCRFEQITTIDRDQTPTLLAKEEFERLLKKFPSTEYARKARLKIRECYIFLARYELYVAHFYFKKKNYRAAMERYQYVLDNYPDLGQYEEAVEYLSRCKQKLETQAAKNIK